MNRRKFIQQSTISAAGMLLLPYFLSSCKKEALFEGKSFAGKVIIVGAGAAGMYAAYLLHRQGVDVTIIEASGKYGGRIRSQDLLADFPIELGTEKVRGERSSFYDLLLASGAEMLTSIPANFYYFNGGLKSEIDATENTFFTGMKQILIDIDDYSGADVTADSYGSSSGISDNVKHIFNGLLGNEFGSSNTRLGMYGVREVREKWSAGSDEFILKHKSLLSVFEEQFSEIIDKIILDTQITAIDYSGSKIALTDSAGNSFEADKVIMTVPLPVLKDGDITFTPALPVSHTSAYQKIGMDRGIKIAMRFDENVWPESATHIYGNGYVPFFEVVSANGRSSNDHVLTAFANGENAEYLSGLGDDMITTILAELDTLFGDASGHYIDHVMQDWGAEPFIRGAYSYPKPGIGNAREVIATNIQGKIYFAGEATHTGGHFGTVHGAMETGLRAVTEILQG